MSLIQNTRGIADTTPCGGYHGPVMRAAPWMLRAGDGRRAHGRHPMAPFASPAAFPSGDACSLRVAGSRMLYGAWWRVCGERDCACELAHDRVWAAVVCRDAEARLFGIARGDVRAYQRCTMRACAALRDAKRPPCKGLCAREFERAVSDAIDAAHVTTRQ